MDEEIKKDAEEEMNCILDLLEDWCLKWGSVGNQEDFDVYRTKKRP